MQKSQLQSILMVQTSLWLTTSNTWDQTISSNLLLDVEINARIGKAATVMAKTKQMGLAEHQSDNEYQTQSLSGMYNQHTFLRK